ncbi:hypothetical protein [Geothrix oryzisoli]|uniref:hypothetical protein n=1 Tax=Geothrix oryzisoli TaxID=2922721 RepID=UPI001FAC17F3|nr:hypothetical protein [Geothrix oryzisoli]
MGPRKAWVEKLQAFALSSPGVFLAITGFAGLLVGLAQAVRPYPFTTTADNLPYYGPLIKAHTDCLLDHGQLLRMVWDLGAGWSPWESGQVGLLYPAYHLANLLARMIGHPLAILETSAWLHLVLAGAFSWRLLPTRFEWRERLLASLATMALPGPFILGANWHNYLACHPWFLAMALLSWRDSELEIQSWRPNLPMVGASLAFFLSAHPSMYVFGVSLLALWTLSYEKWASSRLGMVRLALAQIPAVAPLLYLKGVSTGANPDWMLSRDNPKFILMHAQTLGTWLHGVLVGNLIPSGGFQVWARASWTGIGMFFAPSLVLVVCLASKRRNFRPVVFFLFFGALLSIATFPWLRFLAVGPFAGFRWTWKLSIFFGTLSLLSLLREEGFRGLKPYWRQGILGTLCVLGTLVCLRGLAFDLLPSLQGTHALGAQVVLSESRRCLEKAEVPPGSRLVMIGAFNMLQPLPVPMLGLIGNAPLLYDQGNLSLYEPMEPAVASRAHYGLTVPWRGAIPVEGFAAKRQESIDRLRQAGVQALVAADPMVLAPLGNVSCFVDVLGRRTYVARMPEAMPFTYPWAGVQGRMTPLEHKPDGRLQTASPSDQVPSLNNPRAVDWQRLPDGRWEGTPEGPGMVWVLGVLLGALMTALLLDRSRFRP